MLLFLSVMTATTHSTPFLTLRCACLRAFDRVRECCLDKRRYSGRRCISYCRSYLSKYFNNIRRTTIIKISQNHKKKQTKKKTDRIDTSIRESIFLIQRQYRKYQYFRIDPPIPSYSSSSRNGRNAITDKKTTVNSILLGKLKWSE